MQSCLIMDKMKIVSLNSRGLGNFIKRRKVFNFVKRKHHADVIFLQETHCTTKEENMWSAEFGNKILFANGTSNSKGVAIAIQNKRIVNSIEGVERDINGRYIIVNLKIEGYTYCLCNIYAPNEDKPFLVPRCI